MWDKGWTGSRARGSSPCAINVWLPVYAAFHLLRAGDENGVGERRQVPRTHTAHFRSCPRAQDEPDETDGQAQAHKRAMQPAMWQRNTGCGLLWPWTAAAEIEWWERKLARSSCATHSGEHADPCQCDAQRRPLEHRVYLEGRGDGPPRAAPELGMSTAWPSGLSRSGELRWSFCKQSIA
jgi:hypothetical protein